VLMIEGDRSTGVRVLRALKKRFGTTDEVGFFEMTSSGLIAISDASAFLLADRCKGLPGSVLSASLDGRRPFVSEIQALVAPSPLGTPRRAVVGWDSARLSMVLAVLEAHCGVRFATHDVYLNVAGGYRISEPAADLAVAAALVSSLTGLALPADCVYFGEISLSGAVRPVAHAQQRLKEAEKLGFGQGVIPSGSEEAAAPQTMKTFQPAILADLVVRIAGSKSG
jgi:DNA repair protein RadA/Sms